MHTDTFSPTSILCYLTICTSVFWVIDISRRCILGSYYACLPRVLLLVDNNPFALEFHLVISSFSVSILDDDNLLVHSSEYIRLRSHVGPMHCYYYCFPVLTQRYRSTCIQAAYCSRSPWFNFCLLLLK